MKTIHTILLLSLTVLLLPSCIREGDVNVRQDEYPVMITLGATSRDAGDASGNPADHYINSLRILGYRTSDGTLAFNEMVVGLPASAADANEIEETVDVVTGKFTIVFIANEHSDKDTNSDGTSDLSDLLNGITTAANNNISYLRGLSFSHEAFASDKNIPMSAIFHNINIYDDNTLIDPTKGSARISEWEVKLTRLGIRVDIKLSLTDAQKTAWLGVANPGTVYFNNVPAKAYIFPGIDNSDSFVSEDSRFAELVEGAKEGDLNVFVCQRVILPESSSQTLTKAQALTMKMMEGATPRTGVIAPTPGIGENGYTIPRNHYLDAVAAIAVTDAAMIISTTIAPWNDVSISGELQGPVVLPVLQPEANSYIIPKGWKKPISIPISQVARGYIAAGLPAPSTTGYTASVLWSEMGTPGSATTTAPDVVVRAAGDYITVQAGNTEGNFVIAMKTSNDDILWSWHIWVTDGYYPYTTTGEMPDSNTPNTIWMNYNLGAFNAKSNGAPTIMASTSGTNLFLDSRGLYYQWGRKDPFPMLGNVYARASLTTTAQVLSSPTTFASNSSDYYGTIQIDDNANNNSWGETGSKTAFDPCPPGYRVPVGANPWSGGTWITSTAGGNTNASYGGYYPYSGYLLTGIASIESNGYAWSATGFSTSFSYALRVRAANPIMNSSNRNNGLCVRCVSE